MNYQYSKKYNPIGTYGCAFISLGVWIEEKLGLKADDDEVNRAYAKAVDKGSMSPNCFIQDWEGVADAWIEVLEPSSSLMVIFIGHWNKDNGTHFERGFNSKDIDFEILRVATPWGYHFKTPGFNPYPELTQETDINGRRYFKVR